MTAWLKVEHTTPEKPEIYLIADILDLDPELVFSKLFRVWVWFDNHSENGTAPETLAASLERRVSAPGLFAAMEAVGWMDRGVSEGKKVFILPNHSRHVGQSAKKRALTAVRNAAYRKAKDTTETLPASRGDLKPRHLEKEKEEDKIKSKDKNTYEIPLKGGTLFAIPDDWVSNFTTAYKNVNVADEIQKAIQWNRANAGKRKTRAGIQRHLCSWLSRANDKAQENGPGPAAIAQQTGAKSYVDDDSLAI